MRMNGFLRISSVASRRYLPELRRLVPAYTTARIIADAESLANRFCILRVTG